MLPTGFGLAGEHLTKPKRPTSHGLPSNRVPFKDPMEAACEGRYKYGYAGNQVEENRSLKKAFSFNRGQGLVAGAF